MKAGALWTEAEETEESFPGYPELFRHRGRERCREDDRPGRSWLSLWESVKKRE